MNSDTTDHKFDWGETVKVKTEALSIFRPGEIVSICGMTKTNSLILADKFGASAHKLEVKTTKRGPLYLDFMGKEICQAA